MHQAHISTHVSLLFNAVICDASGPSLQIQEFIQNTLQLIRTKEHANPFLNIVISL